MKVYRIAHIIRDSLFSIGFVGTLILSPFVMVHIFTDGSIGVDERIIMPFCFLAICGVGDYLARKYNRRKE